MSREVYSYRVCYSVLALRAELYDSMHDVYDTEEAAESRARETVAFYKRRAFVGCSEADFAIETYKRIKYERPA